VPKSRVYFQRPLTFDLNKSMVEAHMKVIRELGLHAKPRDFQKVFWQGLIAK